MPNPDWSTYDLPQEPLMDAYDEAFSDTVIRTPMSAGPTKLRRRFTASEKPITVPLLLSATQVAELDTLYETDTLGGSLPFDWENPRTDEAVTMRFVAKPVVASITKILWHVTLALEIMP